MTLPCKATRLVSSFFLNFFWGLRTTPQAACLAFLCGGVTKPG